MLELQLEIQLEGQISLEMEIQNTEIVVVEGFDYFDIDWINPTLAAGALTADFAFSPSPQIHVNKIELWINGVLSETRLSNDESPFVVNGIAGGAEVQIKAYNDNLLMQQSDVLQLPIPVAPDVDLFTFANFKDISMLNYCSDPQSLALELDSVGKPDYGTIELTANDIVKWTKEGGNDVAQGLVDYTIKNSAGLKDSGRLSLAFEEISISIDTPTQNQEIPSDEDITISFTVTPATQNYISAIALVFDGVEVEKRSPYSTADFTIDAGTLTEASHNIRIRAYDLDDVEVFETGQRSFEVVALFDFGNQIMLDGDNDYISIPSAFLNNSTKFTLNFWCKIGESESLAISKYISATERMLILYDPVLGRFVIRVRNGDTLQTLYSVDLKNTIKTIGLVYDASKADAEKVKVYTDGGFLFNAEVSATSIPAGGDFLIGAQTTSSIVNGIYNEIGMIDGIAATPSQMSDLHNSGNGKLFTDVFPTANSSNALYYRCNQSDGASELVDEFDVNNNATLVNLSTPPAYFMEWNPIETFEIIAELGQSNMVGQDGDTVNPSYPFESSNGYYWDGSFLNYIKTDRPPAVGGSHSNYFCEEYFTLSSKRALICSAPSGGSGLVNQSEPDPNNWGTTGGLRAAAESLIDSALNRFNKTAPLCALWNQGESEAATIDTDPSYTKATSKAAMQDVIDWWKNKYPGSKFFISQTGTIVGASASLLTALQEVRDMQQEIVDENADVFMAFTGAKDFPSEGKMKADGIHYNYLGYKDMGEAFAVSVNDNT